MLNICHQPYHIHQISCVSLYLAISSSTSHSITTYPRRISDHHSITVTVTIQFISLNIIASITAGGGGCVVVGLEMGRSEQVLGVVLSLEKKGFKCAGVTCSDLDMLQPLLAKFGLNAPNISTPSPSVAYTVSVPPGFPSVSAAHLWGSISDGVSRGGPLSTAGWVQRFLAFLPQGVHLVLELPAASSVLEQRVGDGRFIPVTPPKKSGQRSGMVTLISCAIDLEDFITRRVLLRCDSTGELYPVTKPSTIPHAFLTSQYTWHQRLGHPGSEVLRRLMSSDSISCNKEKLPVLCHACQLGKHVKLPFVSLSSSVTSCFDIVHSDLWTSPIPSLSGFQYYVLFLDHYSQYVWVYPLMNKSDVLSKFLLFRNYVRTQFKCEIKSFQCDHGGEFDNHAFHKLFNDNGIQFRFSCPRTSQQNGKSERMIRTINNLIRTLLFQAHLPPNYWTEALNMAVYLLNILPSRAINNEIPFTRLFGAQPDYSVLRVFGCLCYPHIDTNHKLGPRATPSIFLGHAANHFGYRCLDLNTNKIIISRHVTFDETVFPFPSTKSTTTPSYDFLDDSTDLISTIIRTAPITHVPALVHTPLVDVPTPPTPPTPPSPPTPQSVPQIVPEHAPSPPNDPPTVSIHPMVTRSRVGTTRPNPRYAGHVSTISPLPRPEGANIVRCMWLFRHKFLANGTLSRYKARLVANGSTQVKGVDVDEILRSLYGLKQAPRAWFQRFAAYITTVGFTPSRCDSFLFIYRQVDDTTFLLLYVDDIVLTASSDRLLQQIIASLHREFSMTDLGALNYLLGILRAHMVGCNSSRTPVDTESKLGDGGTPQVCLYMHDPQEPHFSALKRILRYVQGTLDYGLQLFSSTNDSLIAYSDADWAGCPTTRRSTLGYCVFLGNNLLSWSSKRQPTLSRFSAEAEYRGVANAVAETCWIRNLLCELHTPLSSATIVYCDNVSAVYLSSNLVQHQRTKHIEIDIHFVQDLVATGQVRILHVPSRFQYADIFTKGLPSALFDEFRDSLSVRCTPAPTAREC
ncbi:ribonuclease H-like domain-containing protein [Tanacetum coccineum]